MEGAEWELDRCEFKLGLSHALAVIRQFRPASSAGGVQLFRGVPVRNK